MPKKLFTPLLVICLLLLSFGQSLAQYRLPQGSQDTTVAGHVGQFYLNINGYIAPYASIVLYNQGIYLRATTADEKGFFRLTEVLFNPGVNRICFDAYDFKRLGESYSCINIEVKESTTINEIFLPPTIGLSRTTIKEGGSVTAWGYSMPNAAVLINFGGKDYTVNSDSTGFYKFDFSNIKAGTYKVSTKATLNNKPSLDPQKSAQLKSLSSGQQAVNWIEDLLKKIWLLLTTYWFVSIAIPVFILIVILLWKLFPKAARHHYLHHQYFVGY